MSAIHNGYTIGSFDFEELVDGHIKLIYMNLEEDFLRKGIGKEMLKEALLKFKQFEVPKPESERLSPDDGDYLTKDAEAFLTYCVKENICHMDKRIISSYDDIKIEPKYWKWGIFYYNPSDSRYFVNKRLGIGWTINFARPLSYLVLIVLIIIALLIRIHL